MTIASVSMAICRAKYMQPKTIPVIKDTRAPFAPYTAALKTTTHLQTRCRKPYAATQHLMLLMIGLCTRNMSS